MRRMAEWSWGTVAKAAAAGLAVAVVADLAVELIVYVQVRELKRHMWETDLRVDRLGRDVAQIESRLLDTLTTQDVADAYTTAGAAANDDDDHDDDRGGRRALRRGGYGAATWGWEDES